MFQTFWPWQTSFRDWFATFKAEMLAYASSIGVTTHGYTISTSLVDSDPGAGVLRLSADPQNTSTVVRVDNSPQGGGDISGLLASLDDSSSTIKGTLKIAHRDTPDTKWLLFTVTAVAAPGGYHNITVTPIGSSAASPFANNDPVTMAFTRNGDNGLTADMQNQAPIRGATAGTGAAYTLAIVPAIAGYAEHQSFFVKFHAASAANPTLQISGLPAPPNLVKQLGDGTYANIAADDIPANHRSRVTLLSADQALVELLPEHARTPFVGASLLASGNAIDFANIPNWIKEIDVQFVGVSTTGTADPQLQIGDPGGFETSAYEWTLSNIGGTSVQSFNGSGFNLSGTHAATHALRGTVTLRLQNPATNTWVCSGVLATGSSTVVVGGSKSLSAPLDRVRLTTSGGVQTFDAGSVSILCK